MTAPFYRYVKASAAVQALLGGPELRLYPWGLNNDAQRTYPYVTHQQVGGAPGNYLSGRPDMDSCTLQVDVWAKTAESARAVDKALRDAIELHCYITAWRGESVDPATKVYRISFDCDWIVSRA